MHTWLGLYVYAVMAGFGAGIVVCVGACMLTAHGLLHLGTWIEGHSRIARRIALYYAGTQVVLQFAMYCGGYIPPVAYALCTAALAHHVYLLWNAAWPSHVPTSSGLLRVTPSIILPVIAHTQITSYYATAAGAWAVHMRGWSLAPSMPSLRSHEVVALLAGSVWALPLWLTLGECTAEWSLPTQ